MRDTPVLHCALLAAAALLTSPDFRTTGYIIQKVQKKKSITGDGVTCESAVADLVTFEDFAPMALLQHHGLVYPLYLQLL